MVVGGALVSLQSLSLSLQKKKIEKQNGQECKDPLKE